MSKGNISRRIPGWIWRLILWATARAVGRWTGGIGVSAHSVAGDSQFPGNASQGDALQLGVLHCLPQGKLPRRGVRFPDNIGLGTVW